MNNKFTDKNIFILTRTAAFTALIAFGAFIKIPLAFAAAPVTFQVLFVLLAGAYLGPLYGSFSVFCYLLLGFSGLPVFAGPPGPAALTGPTGGYLIGFLASAAAVGVLYRLRKEPGTVYTFFTMILGVALIYLCGMAHLMLVSGLGAKAAFTGGVLPFIPLDIIKAVIAASIMPVLRTTVS